MLFQLEFFSILNDNITAVLEVTDCFLLKTVPLHSKEQF